RVPGRVRAECEDARVEIEVGSERLALDQPLDVDLGRYDDEDAEDERDEEPLPALAEVLAGRAVAEREAGPDPGDQEEERHPETREEVVELEEERARLRVFDVPPPLGHEEHGGVEVEEEQDREDAEPVEVVAALAPRPGGPPWSCGWPDIRAAERIGGQACARGRHRRTPAAGRRCVDRAAGRAPGARAGQCVCGARPAMRGGAGGGGAPRAGPG